MLRIENLTAGYTKNDSILKGVNLTVQKNEVVAVVGQNGAGKSTLAKSVVNLVPYICGEIFFNGKSIIGKTTQMIVNQGIGFFFQGGRIFPHLTVEENLAFAGQGFSAKTLNARKAEVMEYFDLFKTNGNGRLKLQASYLSGGEQHQLALAMVLMHKPNLLILDEPSAGLSPGNVNKLYEILKMLRRNFKTSFLLIEQNVKMAFEFGDAVLLLQDGLLEKKAMTLKEVEEKYFRSDE